MASSMRKLTPKLVTLSPPPTPKDVYKLLGVSGPTPKDVYKLLGAYKTPTPKSICFLLPLEGCPPPRSKVRMITVQVHSSYFQHDQLHGCAHHCQLLCQSLIALKYCATLAHSPWSFGTRLLVNSALF